jgi:hypothetical protein
MGAAGRAGRASPQRFAMYIVISNPNRTSTNVGFVQAMACSRRLAIEAASGFAVIVLPGESRRLRESRRSAS